MKLNHEIHGGGAPLVLLPGGLMTIGEMAPMTRALSAHRMVIVAELQGHGRTADTDRPLAFDTMGDDVASLIEDLGLGQVDIAGYSLGGDVAIRTAVRHPARVRRLALLSTPFARHGWFPEALEGMAQVGAQMAVRLKDTPAAMAARDWPEPERFPRFLDKLGALLREEYDWSAEIRTLSMPVLLLYADHDAISMRHMTEFFALLGGGLKDPGWLNPELTTARLAIVPGYTHYNFTTAPELGPLIERFLSDPLTKPQGGAAAENVRSEK